MSFDHCDGSNSATTIDPFSFACGKNYYFPELFWEDRSRRRGPDFDAPPKRARSPEDDDSEWALRPGPCLTLFLSQEKPASMSLEANSPAPET